MLQRKIWPKLEAFRESADKKTLLVTGARQVGKTFIIEEFAKRYYQSLVEINFIKEPAAMAIFHDVADEQDVLRRLSAYANGRMIPGSTLSSVRSMQCSYRLSPLLCFIKAMSARCAFIPFCS